jgi:hypothetical protein
VLTGSPVPEGPLASPHQLSSKTTGTPEYKPHKRSYPQVPQVSSRRQAAVNLPATRYRPESQPLEPGNGPQEKAIWDGF